MTFFKYLVFIVALASIGLGLSIIVAQLPK